MSNIVDFSERVEAIRHEAEKLLLEAAQSTFASVDNDPSYQKRGRLETLVVRGYTPSFNDGDPCSFRSDVEGIFLKDSETEDDVDPYEIYPAGAFSLVQDLLTLVYGTEGFRAKFSRDGSVTVEEYDPGY